MSRTGGAFGSARGGLLELILEAAHEGEAVTLELHVRRDGDDDDPITADTSSYQPEELPNKRLKLAHA